METPCTLIGSFVPCCRAIEHHREFMVVVLRIQRGHCGSHGDHCDSNWDHCGSNWVRRRPMGGNCGSTGPNVNPMDVVVHSTILQNQIQQSKLAAPNATYNPIAI